MSVLHEIVRWARGLKPWQQEAISRLYVSTDAPSEQDLDDLYALLKAEHGIRSEKARAVKTPLAASLTAPDKSTSLVQLLAIKDLRNVNALAPALRLPIQGTGLTIIYGDNGAGKSGYARVLKRACRARDQREPIRPNANVAPADRSGPASATFDLLVDGANVNVDWTDGVDAPDVLSTFAVFDSHCARAYIDNHGDFAYSPYGLDILRRLVTVCQRLRLMAESEAQQITPDLEPIRDLSQTPTEVGRLLRALSASTDRGEILQHGQFSDDDRAALERTRRALAEPDPPAKARMLRSRAQRLARVVSRIDEAAACVDDTRILEIRKLVDEASSARQAATIASACLTSDERLLPKTGGGAWRNLFEAARTFAAESHPDHRFPHSWAGIPCPLCQEPLTDDAKERLARFDEWIRGTMEVRAKSAEEGLATAQRALQAANLDLDLASAQLDETLPLQSLAADACANYQESLLTRRAQMLSALTKHCGWSDVAPLATNPRDALTSFIANLSVEASALDAAADEDARAALRSQERELDARRRLAELKGLVLEAIERMAMLERLKKCMDAAGHGHISRKATELSRTAATVELAAALNEEFRKLGVGELHAAMKPESPKGKTQFKLILELPGGNTPSEVLSEGEQRAIAIASFLAEVKIGQGRGGVVFDDPVSSLDHVRRLSVANRLAEEASHRQVIVFTHDIYFLHTLQRAAEDAGESVLVQRIRRTPDGFGVPSESLPFDAMSTKRRIEALRQRQEAIASIHRSGDEDEARRLTFAAYVDLRLAWERAVEEVLLCDTVVRFRESISTNRLKSVFVDDSDYRTIDQAISKCSRFGPHDPAAAAQLPRPHPSELARDIETLSEWAKTVTRRANDARTRRN